MAAFFADYLDDVRKSGSSVGAVIEVVAEGVPAGLGAPVYGKLDADLAAALMGINAVKGVEIGAGFGAAELTGEENADEMRWDRRQAALPLEHSAASSAASPPARTIVRFAVKPTSSILTPRATVDRYGHETEIVTKGRHDPCVGIRAVPIGEAMVACVLADHYLRQRGQVGDSPAWPFDPAGREAATPMNDQVHRRSRIDSGSPRSRGFARGEIVVVSDDDDRENEGDLFVAASMCTPEKMAFIIRHTSGIVCAPLAQDEARRLRLDPMVSRERRAARHGLHRVDRCPPRPDHRHFGRRAQQHGACARQLTTAARNDFVRPGHVFPLIAREGGVLMRSGHTEACVDLCRLAGCRPSACSPS